MIDGDLSSDTSELQFRPSLVDSRRQTAKRQQVVRAPLSCGQVHGQGHPQLVHSGCRNALEGNRKREGEMGRHHADDFAGDAIDFDRLADDVAASGKPAPPETVRDDHNWQLTRLILGCCERTSHQRRHPQDLEKVVRHRCAVNLFSGALAGQREALIPPHAHLLEGAAAFPPVGEVRRGDEHVGQVLLVVGLPQDNEPVGICEGQRFQDDCVHDTEDRGRGADSQRKRQHCDGRKAGTLDERAHAVADVLKERAQRGSQICRLDGRSGREVAFGSR